MIKCYKFEKSANILTRIGPVLVQKTIISDGITYQCIRFDKEYLNLENTVFKEPNFNFADFLYFLSPTSFIATLICIVSCACFGFSLLLLFHCLKMESY